MTGIFKQKTPANIFILLVFGILLKLPIFIDPVIPVKSEYQGILYTFLLDFLAPSGTNNPVLYPILAYFFLFSQAMMLNYFINSHRMMNKTSYYPGMAYLLVSSLFPEWNYFSAPLLINTLLLFILSGLFISYHRETARGIIFNIGLAVGVAGFIYYPSLSFIIWILLALVIMRPFRINEWLICIAGVLTPCYFYGVYLFLTDQWSWGKLFPKVEFALPVLAQSAWLAGSVFLLILPFIAGGYYVQDNLRRMLIQVRKGWSLILLFLSGSVFVPFFNTNYQFENWIISAIPFAAFHACTYFYSEKRWFPLLLFWITVAFILCYQYAGPGW